MRLAIVVPAVISFSMIANAALPPLSERERQMSSTNIVVGTITDIEETILDAGGNYRDTQYRAKMMVTKVEKGSGIELGSELEVFYWKALERPRGWAGPTGQYGNLQPYSMVRAYLVGTPNSGYSLIEPNGTTLMR